MAEIQVQAKLRSLRAAFNTGKTRPYSFRIQQLTALKASILKNAELGTDALFADHHRRPEVSMMIEIGPTLRYLDYLLANLKEWMKSTSHDLDVIWSPGSIAVEYEPLGAVLVMGAWNVPIGININKLATAMAAGNVVLLKPSEIAENSAGVISKIMEDLD